PFAKSPNAHGGRSMSVSSRHHFRFHAPHAHLASVFGDDWFAVRAEAFARFFGTPLFLVAQTVVVAFWIAVNAVGLTRFDVYPFILLNLAFSLQAAYAAPLILLAQTRQADRDRRIRGEVGRRVVTAEAFEHPVEHGSRCGVVERRLRDTGHARQVLPPARHAQELPDGAGERRDAARRGGAVGAVASLAVERVVERRAAHVGARCAARGGRSHEHRDGPKHHDLRITTWSRPRAPPP